MTRSAWRAASGLDDAAASFGVPPAGSVPSREHRLVRQYTLTAEPRAAKLARDFTRAALPEWGHEDLVDDVSVVASELVTNAVRYGSPRAPHANGDSPIQFGLIQEATLVLCTVHDCGIIPPSIRGLAEPAESESLREAGRGLGIVARLATTWGWTRPDRDGKTVWAVFATVRHGSIGDESITPALPHRNQAPALNLAFSAR